MEEDWDDASQSSSAPYQNKSFDRQDRNMNNRKQNDFGNYQRGNQTQNRTRGFSRNNDAYQNTSQMSRSFSRNNDGYQNTSRTNFPNRSNDGYQSASQGNRSFSNESEEDKCTFFVETSKLGKLIGRGGCQIKELQEQSGARINVNKDCVNGDSTLIIVNGDKDSQTKARSLIDDLLRDPEFISSNPPKIRENNDPPAEIDWAKAAKQHDEYQVEKWSKYGSIKKDFYTEDPSVANLSKEEVERIRREKNNISVQYVFESGDSNESSVDNKIPNPVESFEQAFQHYPDILVEIKKQGFEKPSPIQCQAWPVLLSGKDMIGIAQTGTGKTLAFLLPALIHIDGQETPCDQRSGPTVLIMAPTRELAQQIEKEVKKYSYHGIKAVCLYGGGNRREQMNTVSKGVEIVIATPGRLNDLIQTEVLDVKSVSYLVLDEADRMLDMGFEPQIRKTLLDVRPDRQSVMTSATWPAGVRRLAQSYMKNPITVCVGSLDLKATHSVTQKIFIVDEDEKIDMLKDFFQNMTPDDKVIVFFGKKDVVDNIGSDLALNGVNCQSIHGGRDQSDREQALADIKSGEVRILLATDVASRGIDIEDLTYVYNYDFPRDIEEYVHRVGRTGRAGRTGESISLMTRRDWSQAAELIKILEEAEQQIPEELYSMAERYEVMAKKRAEEDREFKGGRRYGGGNDGGRRGGGRDRYGGGGGSGRGGRW